MASVLILGGTRDALELAALLDAAGFQVTTSLAGVTSRPQRPIGELRSGGFGGKEGLATYARDFDLIADATHPFAARISAHAHLAAAELAIPYVRLERPSWEPQAGDQWFRVADIDAAAAAIMPNAHVFLTIGRKHLAPFLARADLSGVIRLIERPETEPPPRWKVVQARPPFSLEEEAGLMEQEAISTLVSKNSGGALTDAKLGAARARGLPVFMIDRPVKPQATTAPTPAALAGLIAQLLPA